MTTKTQVIHPVNSQFIEFQAVVLAGGTGSRLSELRTTQPHCLLPIANRPMIWYPLHTLERSGFKEAIVIVYESAKSDILVAIEKLNLKIKIDLVGVNDTADIGTADSIRHIHEKIHTDFLVISCDLITNIDLLDVLNVYRIHNASITALMFPVPKTLNHFVTAGLRNKIPETDLIGIDNMTNRLIFLASTWDYKNNVNFPMKMLKKHPTFTIHTKLIDAHLYIINKWVLDYIVYNKTFSSLKSEVLPFIVGKQLSRENVIERKEGFQDEEVYNRSIFDFVKKNSHDVLINQMSSSTDHITDLEDPYHGDVIRCYAYVSKKHFGLRANTVQMYHFANAKISAWWDVKNDSQLSPLPGISSTATVHSTQIQECCIDQKTIIEKSSLKRSHIGPKCKIEQYTKIQDSVIMKNVNIKEKCTIDNCILCNNCVIAEGVELKDCIVGPQYVVKANSKHLRDTLTEDVDTFLEY